MTLEVVRRMMSQESLYQSSKAAEKSLVNVEF